MKARKFTPLLVVAAGLLAYHNSFMGPFIFDDVPSIQENPTIRRLWPITQPLSPPHRGGLTVEGRPIVNLSLAVNYAIGRYAVAGYHAVNLTLHILAGLTLLGVMRRTLRQPALRVRFGAAADGLALATAVLWTVHPLQTESVTYVIQRAELLMGLFYLLTLYCFIRGVESPVPRLWYSLCVTACALGMASKEVMVSAPIMVLLYDRTFLSKSIQEAWRQRRQLYVSLAATWLLLIVLLVSADSFGFVSVNARRAGFTWWAYLLTEPAVILHYLQLSLWPYPLCLDYGWPIARSWMSILPQTIVIVLLLGASLWAWRAKSAWGFAGAWFFLILAPSSSLLPLESPAFEHRMYLPLAAVMTLVVMGLYSLADWRSAVVFVAVAIGFGFLTARRNEDYRSELAIWQDTAIKRPDNPRARSSVGVAVGRQGGLQEAIKYFEQALRLKPDYADAHSNLGTALLQEGKLEDAIGHYEQALQTEPNNAQAHFNLGVALEQAGQRKEALGQYQQALLINPDFAEAHNNLGNVLLETGELEQAIGQYRQALRINPDYADVHNNLGATLLRSGKVQEAIEHFEEAVRIVPGMAEAHFNLGSALWQSGRVDGAIGQYEQAVQIKPDYVEAHYNLGVTLEQSGRVADAIKHYQEALRIKPDFTEAQSALARVGAAR